MIPYVCLKKSKSSTSSEMWSIFVNWKWYWYLNEIKKVFFAFAYSVAIDVQDYLKKTLCQKSDISQVVIQNTYTFSYGRNIKFMQTHYRDSHFTMITYANRKLHCKNLKGS